MPLWRSHKVWIESDGERYEEYDVKVEGNVVTCYIASQIDKTFQILWTNTEVPMVSSSLVYMEVDGAKLDNFVSRHYMGSYSGISRGHWLDANSFRPFKFSQAALTADDDAFAAPSKDLGTISVIVYRVVVASEKVAYRPEVLPDYFQKPLSERAKKMSGHRISLDISKSVSTPRTSVSTTAYQGETSPYVTFRFIYRPKDILRALDIISATQAEGSKRPRTPSPVAGPSRRQGGHVQRSKKRRSEVKTEEETVIELPNTDDDVERQLIEQQAEVARKLEEHRKRKSLSGSKGKMKMKTEEGRSTSEGPADLVYDADGAIDLTLD